MLEFDIPKAELYVENDNSILHVKPCHLLMEHSLLSVRKWEAIYQKPFFPKNPYLKENRTFEETISYLQCMTVQPKKVELPAYLYIATTPELNKKVSDYTTSPMGATTFKDLAKNKKGKNMVITASVIYAMMVNTGIPFECQTWHLNELLTLIRTVSELNNGPQKMSPKESAEYRHAINEMNRARFHKH